MAATLGGTPQRVVLWLRNDLRLHDSAVFHQAAKLVEQGPCEVNAFAQSSGRMRIVASYRLATVLELL